MPENNQASDKTKPEATGSSSTQPGSQAIDMNHTNVIVPHRISNHDKLVQTMVMVDGEWVNVNDTNDQKNVQEDMHKVNRVVTEAQKDIINAQNAADSAVKSADSAISASKVNSDAIAAQGEAISEAKIALDSAAAEIQLTASNAASDAAKIRADVAQMQSEVDTAKAANSATVEALKSDVSAAKQDIQAARQANENVAKQLDDYTKQAQAQGKTIKDIQNAQDGYTATLADVKGNVSKISDAVDGLSASLKDDQDNVATIKAKADELSATLTDHDKNIAQLTASAKELSSTLEDADGRLSKVEQTAATLTNEFADQQGHLNRVEQTAQGTEQTVANQQGQINSIQTDAAGIHQTLTGQGNQIANINVTLSGLNTKYEGVSGDLGKLKDQVTTNSTQITQNKQAIALKADQTTVDNLSGEVNQNKAQLKVQADQISSKVSSTDFTALNGRTMQNRGTVNAPDFNTLTQAGYYTVTNPNSGKNYPIGNWGTLEVSGQTVDGNGRLNQKYVGDNNGGTYTRQYNANTKTWTAWIKTASQNDINTLDGKISKNSTAIDQTNKQISLKADQTEVNNAKEIASQNSSRLDVMAGQISSKVTATDVNNIVDGKGYATTSTVQSLITQKAGTINESITSLDSKYNTTVTQVQSLTASIDGLQSTVANKADKSRITQLSNLVQSKVSSTDFNNLRKAVDLQTLESADANNLKTNGHYFVHNLANNPVGGWVYVDVTGNGNDRIRQDVYQDIGNKHKYRRWFGNSWTNWSEGATESEITQLRDDINLRVKSGDLLSQINIEAGRTLIQSNKIYFDADSFVMSPNSKAFIPSAFITNLSADKITTGTLDASKLHVKNFSADNISGGTLSGVVVKSGIKDEYFQTTKSNIYWVHNKKTSLIGTDTYINPGDGLVIADEHTIMLTTWWGAMINDDGSITNNAGAMGYPKIVIDQDGLWDPGVPGGADWEHGPGSQEVAQWVSDKEYTTLTQGKGFRVRLDDQNKNSTFSIQKDNCVGAYFGQGDNGNQINFNFGGDGCGFNVNGPLHVTGSKNSIVETRQGYLAINAYETAEYYFGDIGENNTGDTSQVVIGIDRIFNEVVNTDIQYQVFVTPYSNAHVWVEKRYNNRFIVKSDRPNAEFGWELKAKRKGYESNRLRRVNVDFNQMDLKGEN